jgi:hypothetical protein
MQITLRSTKTDPEPTTCEAKCAAQHQTRRNNPAAERHPRASGGTCCSMVAKTGKNGGASG